MRSGVDRVSIGCQSFDPRHLETLERHDPASVPRAVERLRHAGIGRLSLDLIFGIPGSTLEDWERDLDQAIALEPDHLSCYGLVFEDGTPLAERRRLGRSSRSTTRWRRRCTTSPVAGSRRPASTTTR